MTHTHLKDTSVEETPLGDAFSDTLFEKMEKSFKKKPKKTHKKMHCNIQEDGLQNPLEDHGTSLRVD